MNQEIMRLYQKAIKREKRKGITDPLMIIADLESEIDDYRTVIKKQKSQDKLNDIQSTIGKVNSNVAIITKEDENYLYATNLYGNYKYSKLQLAIFWLTHSNDCFYETFGFSWVPSNALQELARTKINCNSNIAIGIDYSFGKDEQISHVIPFPDTVSSRLLEDILQGINPTDMVSHHHSMSSVFHTK